MAKKREVPTGPVIEDIHRSGRSYGDPFQRVEGVIQRFEDGGVEIVTTEFPQLYVDPSDFVNQKLKALANEHNLDGKKVIVETSISIKVVDEYGRTETLYNYGKELERQAKVAKQHKPVRAKAVSK